MKTRERFDVSLYTRNGDSGDTSLIGGRRVPKTDVQVEAYGSLDEAIAFVSASYGRSDTDLTCEALSFMIQKLTVCASLLAATPDALPDLSPLGAEDVEGLEKRVDALEQAIGPLKGFVSFTDGESGSTINIARTVVRRAERRVYAYFETLLDGQTDCALPEELRFIPQFLNRCSDALFACACIEQMHQCGQLLYQASFYEGARQ